MTFPLRITFHNTRRSRTAENLVHEHVEKLDKYNQRIQDCEVVIDQPHHHQNKGNDFHVRVLISVPGNKITVTSSAQKHGDHTSLPVALRDAFETARRQLRTHRKKPRDRRIRKHLKDSELNSEISASA